MDNIKGGSVSCADNNQFTDIWVDGDSTKIIHSTLYYYYVRHTVWICRSNAGTINNRYAIKPAVLFWNVGINGHSGERFTRHNESRSEGYDVPVALQKAEVGRFQAIFLTTATTVAG
jgi:hypothetical protein